MDLMSGKGEREGKGAVTETPTETGTGSSSSYLPGDMAEQTRGGANSSGGRGHHCSHKRLREAKIEK